MPLELQFVARYAPHENAFFEPGNVGLFKYRCKRSLKPQPDRLYVRLNLRTRPRIHLAAFAVHEHGIRALYRSYHPQEKFEYTTFDQPVPSIFAYARSPRNGLHIRKITIL
jgi:hypothetical protein